MFCSYLRNCRLYHQDFDNNIYRCFSLFFLKKCNIVNTKIIFLLAHFNSFLKNYLFINKCQKEIMRFAPPSSHVCDFFSFFVFLLCFVYLTRVVICNFNCNFMLFCIYSLSSLPQYYFYDYYR